MHIAIVTQYFWPEDVGPGVFLHQLASDLTGRGERVTVLTAFPSYPLGQVSAGYRGKYFLREPLDGTQVVRTWTYATASKRFWPRVLSFGSFCGSALLGGLGLARPDVFYCVVPPLPLGLSAGVLSLIKHAPLVLNVQDIYPDIAIELGYLKSRPAIRFFHALEGWIYRRAAEIVVIADSFRTNLLSKGVPGEKIHVVPNWADAEEIQPGPKHNAFRAQLGSDSRFTLIYAGSLSHNSSLEALVEAASRLAEEPYRFVLVGDGVHKPRLQEMVERRGLNNVTFLPFQPWSTYPNVLRAADVQLVSLNAASSHLSLPSKVVKIMAAGRPILAQAAPHSDLARLVRQGACGEAVHPDDDAGLAATVRRMFREPEELERMGQNARRYFLQHFDRQRCVAQVHAILQQAATGSSGPRTLQ